ncbi:acetyl/propionyl/methylcrotonyl-CoA carboxylase subunit alpha [Actinomadura citrea]|uniref:biotin carboxylase n=1 Tax=Actinomadura citrea TaxID=46158 RepID=A0A7Y9KD00_9ACTN|nr:biotin carboxylase N-terminal domain-containing protein [Actinomadura citrea]NYE14557.1 acetyl-CoA/propionyl-CoA carboxylase biotin carboxyl carrier protein [Actinomadura citrea]GGU09428.1 acetyl-/propionyl-CoA carboxylase subunit alpha [Actinomadura citrea]
MRKILIANRGEIAVRVVRACRDAGLASVAVYADPDVGAPHARMADEAYALGGATPADTYLDIGKVLKAAADAGADAVHPGYGFLSESAEFARAVIDEGLVWIGPPPSAIDLLGDKVQARRVAREQGAPLAPGTPEPVSGAGEAVAFGREHGLPVAIKAAFGGGGRGLKVARTLDEIPDRFESAVREAETAFGRGECFVERYLDRPRHVETQCLADRHGNVVVVSTRDCTLQRRHQKLVEEAPAPFLTEEQRRTLYESSKKILRAAGYVGAGTCEFLVAADGALSFLEVNTRLQVEHPVTEEVTGIDLVREMFRIAEGEALGYGDPAPRGHAMEFRINAEDPGRGFLPATGTLATWRPPSGPGVRLDGGCAEGQEIPGQFDSLLAKLVVTGPTRDIALQRARRALAEFEVAGIPTVLPFHRAVVEDKAFTGEPFDVHTAWIESDQSPSVPPCPDSSEAPAPPVRKPVTVEVDGKRVEVVLHSSADAPAAPSRPRPRRAKAKEDNGDALVCPLQSTIVKVLVEEGDTVAAGDTIVVVEAMKMEQPLTAHKSGTVSALNASPGRPVTNGAEICLIR